MYNYQNYCNFLLRCLNRACDVLFINGELQAKDIIAGSQNLRKSSLLVYPPDFYIRFVKYYIYSYKGKRVFARPGMKVSG